MHVLYFFSGTEILWAPTDHGYDYEHKIASAYGYGFLRTKFSDMYRRLGGTYHEPIR